ncbi:hypothetical protein BDZ45DRAFT_661829 [Acephala macrosclerotiorum]|nr:hypothetical protein BDZ45DRAFT_661829 [Acephala macrosclerotiorum]
MKRDENAGIKPSIATIDTLSGLYRENVRITEEQKERKNEIKNTLEVITAMRKTEEQSAPEITARATSSRSGMEFDGPSDSPIPSPADNRQARKFGTSRTGSQPPSRPDGTPSEGSDKAKQPKIVYEKGQEVAFKRKTPGKPEEQDWIQGRVVRVIGEGKSRRYDVEDPYPDNKEENGPPPAPIIYKSSASQMVPIPPEGSHFKDYEIGRRVLALYPETTTFYRAEVKAILNDGSDVQLLFEDEAAGELKIVTRRLVLDHKG